MTKAEQNKKDMETASLLIEAARQVMPRLDGAQRYKLKQTLIEGYCDNCGDVLPCYCCNDE